MTEDDENKDATQTNDTEEYSTMIINSPEINYDTVTIDESDGEYQTVPNSKPSLKDLIMIETKRLVALSKSYKEKIDTAKTKPKKDLYLKKLRKNNKKLADMIMRIERLNQIESSNDESTSEQT